MGKRENLLRKSDNQNISYAVTDYKDTKSDQNNTVLVDKTDTLSSVQQLTDFEISKLKLFSQDFDYIKEKLIKVQQRLDDSEKERRQMETQLEVVKTENVKLISDIKIMRNEHSEIMHTMTTLERKFDQLERENQYLKTVIQSKPPEPMQGFGYK